MSFHAATVTVSLATFLIAAIPARAQVFEWSVETITTDAQTPLHPDFRRPMAVGYYDTTADQTFVSFTGANMIPHVATYDHVTNVWDSPVSVPMHPPTTDAHDYSHIFQLGDGRIGLTTSRHNQELYFARSENPHSIEGNWTVMEIGNSLDATYPMPMVSQSDGSISILYRETKSADYRPINIVRSTDNGATWSSPQPAIDYENSRNDYLNEIYLGAMSYEADHPSLTLGEGYHGTWTIAGGGGPEYGHRHDRFHKNMYYAFFSLADQNWYAADGTNLGTNITDAEAETHALVFDSGALEGTFDQGNQDIGYVSKTVLDDGGNPLVVFENGKTFNIDIARWDGIQWNVTTPPLSPARDWTDLAIVDDKVWLLGEDGNGGRVLELQSDGSWADIAFYNPVTNARQNFFIDNGHPEAFILSVDDNTGGGVYAVSTVPVGDFNGDFLIDAADWVILRDNSHTDLSALTLEAAYLLGDLDGDLDNDMRDFGLFRDAYEAAHPAAGAFEAMAASAAVPEPSSIWLLAAGAAGLGMWRLRS